ncbi:MAG: alpha/beta hydrolase fold domain-containing protein [Bdellovibrionaceae bacterium]|nr:alpha/beta hydrolase fold domain-containing protein [Pseudobdellovibrionaceae bacterium]
MIRSIVTTVLILIASTKAFTAEFLTLQTLRGLDVNVTLHIPQGSNLPAIVVAPGSSCNSKGPLFETLAQLGETAKVAIIRFEWNYCISNPSDPVPSFKYRDEIEAFQTVLEYTKQHASIDKTKIVLAGKSLGSHIAYAVFAKETSAKALVLLTPICSYTTDRNGTPLSEHQRVCEEVYPKLKDDKRPVLMTMGNDDSLCLLPILYDFLKDSKGNISTFVAGGNHGFSIKDSDGNVDQVKTEKNINTVISAILNWMDINI